MRSAALTGVKVLIRIQLTIVHGFYLLEEALRLLSTRSTSAIAMQMWARSKTAHLIVFMILAIIYDLFLGKHLMMFGTENGLSCLKMKL